MNIDDYISIVEKQESALHFSGFGRKDAWELGQLMVSRILKEGLKLSASIKMANGLSVFQYMPEGTTADNVNWMTRKFNVVRDFEISSLHNKMRLIKKNQTFQDRGLDPAQYAASGGGFPVHVSGTGVIGVILVSGLPHLADHDFIVESVSRFLKIQDVPRIPVDVQV